VRSTGPLEVTTGGANITGGLTVDGTSFANKLNTTGGTLSGALTISSGGANITGGLTVDGTSFANSVTNKLSTVERSLGLIRRGIS
jgi:hypothetical protein